MSGLLRKKMIPLILGLLLCQNALASPRVAPDKRKHFAASAALALTGYWGAALIFDGRRPRLAIGSACALSAGVGKELYDLAGHGTPSWADLGWDVLGTALGLSMATGIDLFWQHHNGAPKNGTPTTWTYEKYADIANPAHRYPPIHLHGRIGQPPPGRLLTHGLR